MLVKSHIGLPHPIFADCKQGIVTAAPSYIVREEEPPTGRQRAFDLLCCFPPFPRALRNNGEPVFCEPGFAAGSSGQASSKERFLILSGYGPFLNCAIGQGDELDNATFTANTMRWLTDNKQRKYCLFFQDNKVVSKFDVPLFQPPIPDVHTINDLLRDMENENLFNRFVLDLVPKNRILRVLLGLTLFALPMYGLRRFARARYRQDYAVPLVEGKLAHLVADYVPPLARRQHHALRAGDFREAAHVLARECFENAPGGRQATAPPISVPPDDALLKAVKQLWSLAFTEDATPIGAEEFGRIVTMVDRVKAALARGTLCWK